MHAFFVTGGTPETRLAWITKTLDDKNVSSFDRVVLKNEENSIGVADVREFTKKLSLAPYHGLNLAGIIQDAHKLTTEAQNALLKTLEEPAPKSIIFLETVSADVLLPTIASRCQTVSLTSIEPTSEDLQTITVQLEKIMQSSIGERIKLIDAIAIDRDASKEWVENAISATRLVLLQEYISVIPAKSLSSIQSGTGIHQDGSPIGSGMTTQLIRKLLHAQKQLSSNVTPKLVLDEVFIS